MRWHWRQGQGLCALVVLACRCDTAAAGVKWTPNTNVRDEDRAAHEAPRSQRYWDKHDIQRPEYAKTDAEVARERRERGETAGLLGGDLMIFVLLCAIATAVYAKVTGNSIFNGIAEFAGMTGQRLGSAHHSRGLSDEERRKARLARFEKDHTKED